MRHVLRGYQLRLFLTCVSLSLILISSLFIINSNIPIEFDSNRSQNGEKTVDKPSRKSAGRTLIAEDLSLDVNYKPEAKLDLDSTKNDVPPKQAAVGPGYGKPKPSIDNVVDYRPVTRETDLLDLEKVVNKLYPNDTKGVECGRNITLDEYYKNKTKLSYPTETSWDRYFAKITSCELYQNYDDADELLHDLATMKVKQFDKMPKKEKGTHQKLLATFMNGKRAVLKPMRYSREHETDSNLYYFSEIEKHNAEIAAFHLDRVLGFNRAIPTVGRVFNLTVVNKTATEQLQNDFYTSPGNNYCFAMNCPNYCGSIHPVCANPHMKEFSVQAHLPYNTYMPLKLDIKSPYRRSASKTQPVADFQKNDKFCQEQVLNSRDHLFLKTHRGLLDLIDTHIFDFLTRNQDRHHLQSFTMFNGRDIRNIYNIFMDNGRGFGIHSTDDLDILAPLIQCCLIRPSTLKMLLKYYSGPVSLSKALQISMLHDAAYPVLIPAHYAAIERRLGIILEQVRKCIEKSAAKDVIVPFRKHKRKTVNVKFQQ